MNKKNRFWQSVDFMRTIVSPRSQNKTKLHVRKINIDVKIWNICTTIWHFYRTGIFFYDQINAESYLYNYREMAFQRRSDIEYIRIVDIEFEP